MIMKRIISTLLVVITLVSSLSLAISAADASSEDTVYEFYTNKISSQLDYLTGEYKPDKDRGEESPIEGLVDTADEKLYTMDLRLQQYGYQLYVDEYSGEVAVKNIETGEVLFTNPYDVSSNGNLEDKEKYTFLSQVLIEYTILKATDGKTSGSYTSYLDAVKGGEKKNDAPSQLTVKYIKNGIRVEYAIGRTDSRYLTPGIITKKRFEEKILNVAIEAGATEGEIRQLTNFYDLQSYEALLESVKNVKNPERKQQRIDEWCEKYPQAINEPVYYFNGSLPKEFKAVETIIKKYCPEYTYEELDEDHRKMEYTPPEKPQALFNIALEYTLDEQGLSVRVPSNSIRFDETRYRIENIDILPYMGAGSNHNSGYTFFPDGAGTLFDFEELASTGLEFFGDVYGEDFAFYDLGTGAPHNEVVRYPVFGIKEDVVDAEGNERSRGFVAIVEQGDSMVTFYAEHTSEYNTVRTRVNPRPYDSYQLSSVISVAGDKMFTVLAPRKYTGNYVIRYVMLTDSDVKTGKGYYDASYVGMAKAYREYLINNEVLTKLTQNDIKEDIPLYIETFGAIETTEKFLSIPYQTMKPLTTFEDITIMYDELAKNDITNINFILTGYTKGGLSTDQIPYSLNWENAVEKEMKFDELLDYAKSKGFGVYPDFDFVFASDNKMFDGLSLKKHAVQTVDGRYTSKREYSATRQTYVSYFELAMSPAYFSHFYEKLSQKYLKYNPQGISVSTLGSYLNSDFDEDEPYHREESKEQTVQAFEALSKSYYKVLTSGGNAYTWKYVDYITDISVDSSRHSKSSATVPFLGIVLHGYVQYAGEAINMEGNLDYAMLRAIENGAALKFILSYQNTSLLKENENTSKYYSVRYDIWSADLIEIYNEVNGVLGGLQLSTIEHHEFLDGVRIPDADEIALDAAKALLDAIEKEKLEGEMAEEEFRTTLKNVKNFLNACKDKMATVAGIGEDGDKSGSAQEIFKEAEESYLGALMDAKTMLEKEESKENPDPAKVANLKNTLKDEYVAYIEAVSAAIELGETYLTMYEFATKNFDLLAEYNIYTEAIRTELAALRDDLADEYEVLKAVVDVMKKRVSFSVYDLEQKYADVLANASSSQTEIDTDATFDKYAAAKNSIVYEVYQNGTAFVLNFNSYAVKVNIGGLYYTVDAYGYIIMN